MKKILYYLSPFIIVPFLAVAMEIIDDIGFIRMSPTILLIVLGVVSDVTGSLSTAKTKFDYIMTAMMPLSFFLTMFVAGFLDKDDLETRFNLDRAFETAFQPYVLIFCLTMAIIVFFASYEKIRITKIIRR